MKALIFCSFIAISSFNLFASGKVSICEIKENNNIVGKVFFEESLLKASQGVMGINGKTYKVTKQKKTGFPKVRDIYQLLDDNDDVLTELKYTMNGTATATNTRFSASWNAWPSLAATVTSLGTNMGGNSTGSVGIGTISGSILVNAGGTLNVQFAQEVLGVTDTKVLQGSYYTITKI